MCIRRYLPDGSDGARSRRVVRFAYLLPESIKPGFPKQVQQATAEHVPGDCGISGHFAIRSFCAAPDRPVAIADFPADSAKPTGSALPDFVNGVLSFQNAANRVKIGGLAARPPRYRWVNLRKTRATNPFRRQDLGGRQ